MRCQDGFATTFFILTGGFMRVLDHSRRISRGTSEKCRKKEHLRTASPNRNANASIRHFLCRLHSTSRGASVQRSTSTHSVLRQSIGNATVFDSCAAWKLGEAWLLRTSPIARKIYAAAFPILDQRSWAQASCDVCHEKHISVDP